MSTPNDRPVGRDVDSVMRSASQMARSHKRPFVCSLDILIALLDEVSVQVAFANSGVDVESLRRRLREVAGAVSTNDIVLKVEGRHGSAPIVKAALIGRRSAISCVDLCKSLLAYEPSVAMNALRDFGIDTDRIRWETEGK